MSVVTGTAVKDEAKTEKGSMVRSFYSSISGAASESGSQSNDYVGRGDCLVVSIFSQR